MITMGLGRSEPSRNHLTDCGESIYVTSTLTVGRDLQERPPAQRFPVHAAGTADRGRKDRCPTTGQRAPSEEVAASRLPTGLPCSRTCQWSQNASLGMPHLWYGSGMASPPPCWPGSGRRRSMLPMPPTTCTRSTSATSGETSPRSERLPGRRDSPSGAWRGLVV
jgi:hypothetical protein